MQNELKISPQSCENCPSFADDQETFAKANQSCGLDGDKIRIEQLLNKKIVFTDFKVRESQYKRFGEQVLMVQVLLDGQKRVFFTQSARIRQVLELFKDKLPRAGTIIKENRAWRIV